VTRDALLTQLAATIASVARPHPIRVAIDGPDTAGKTTLADELVRPLTEAGRIVIRASVDGFHRPRAERYRQGRDSSIGYYEDAFDYQALRRDLLDPLGPEGDLEYRTAVFDYRADGPVAEVPQTARRDAILLVDGVFLLRPELVDGWEFRIFVCVSFDEMLRRGLERDAGSSAAREEVERLYRARYIPGQELYLTRARPTDTADVLVENDDPLDPELRWPARRAW
jgi:uridine kinase